MEIPEYVIIIANSGRMLAEAAVEAGLKPLVIDLYADSDTRGFSVAVHKISSLTQQYIAPILDELIGSYNVSHLVYGSGFENHPESLIYLNERLTILGNTPDIFFGAQNKARFFSVLDALKIPYPEVAFEAPDDAENWLVKPMQGQGGLGIKRYDPVQRASGKVYWQKFQFGAAHSVLFLANGREAQVIGFNAQWTENLNENGEFVFAGAVNNADLGVIQKSVLSDWIIRCAKVFALKGLNSLDFIVADGRCLVLEINPRPPASMQLYDDLLIRHILSVQGVLFDKLLEQTDYTGCRIVFACCDLMIPDRFDWPEECKDRPESGVICRKGQPICSIISRQSSAIRVRDRLNLIQQQLVKQMIRVQPYGI